MGYVLTGFAVWLTPAWLCDLPSQAGLFGKAGQKIVAGWLAHACGWSCFIPFCPLKSFPCMSGEKLHLVQFTGSAAVELKNIYLIIWLKGRKNPDASWMISRGWTWGRAELSQAEIRRRRRFKVGVQTSPQQCQKNNALSCIVVLSHVTPALNDVEDFLKIRISSFSAWEGASDFSVQEQISASLLPWTHFPSAQELQKILLQSQFYFISAGVLGILLFFFF